MFRTMLKAKIHRATVTGSDLSYEGSITIDEALLEAADILPNEKVHVFNLGNGARVETYAIPAEAGSGEVVVNGAAAHHFSPGDLAIILSFAVVDEVELAGYSPKVILVDENNRVSTVRREKAVLPGDGRQEPGGG